MSAHLSSISLLGRGRLEPSRRYIICEASAERLGAEPDPPCWAARIRSIMALDSATFAMIFSSRARYCRLKASVNCSGDMAAASADSRADLCSGVSGAACWDGGRTPAEFTPGLTTVACLACARDGAPGSLTASAEGLES